MDSVLVEEAYVEDELVYGLNNLHMLDVESSAGSAEEGEDVGP
jgi:hypothetical protein